MSINKGKFDITSNIISFQPKEIELKFDVSSIITQLENYLPGNYDAKIQLLLTIQQAYFTKCKDDADKKSIAKEEPHKNITTNNNTYKKNAILLNGNAGVGKSSLIKGIGELTSIPIIRLDLDSIIASSYVDPFAATTSSDVLFLIQSVLYELHEVVLEKDLDAQREKPKYFEYIKKIPSNSQNKENKETILLREKPNAQLAIIELDNSEELSQGDPIKKNVAKILQSAIAEVIRKPLTIIPGGLTTKYFTYIFSSDLSNLLAMRNVGFRLNKNNTIDAETLIDLGFSKGMASTLTNIVNMKDLNAKDFEHYLSRQDSRLQQGLRNLSELYDMKVSLNTPAIKLVAKYLENNGKNLRGIEEATRKILDPHYISPQKGAKIIIDTKYVTEKLYKDKY